MTFLTVAVLLLVAVAYLTVGRPWPGGPTARG
jgi:hypothetical protein